MREDDQGLHVERADHELVLLGDLLSGSSGPRVFAVVDGFDDFIVQGEGDLGLLPSPAGDVKLPDFLLGRGGLPPVRDVLRHLDQPDAPIDLAQVHLLVRDLALLGGLGRMRSPCRRVHLGSSSPC